LSLKCGLLMILVLGVTASGKGALAFDLARRLGGEIVSIDSMKVYRRMDIGTAKPPPVRREQVRHHIIDVVEPHESFSVDQFLRLAGEAVGVIRSAGRRVIGVGGTALYIKALLYGIFDGPPANYEIRKRLKAEIAAASTAVLHGRLAEIDPLAAQRIHPNDARRLIRALEVYELTGKPISSLQKQFGAESPIGNWTIIGLRRPKAVESRRINARVKKMIQQGLVDEVKSLLGEDKPLSKQASCAIGYAEIINHLKGRTTLDEAIERIKINTRRFAKAQRTWFKTFMGVNWLDIEEDWSDEDLLERAMRIIESKAKE